VPRVEVRGGFELHWATARFIVRVWPSQNEVEWYTLGGRDRGGLDTLGVAIDARFDADNGAPLARGSRSDGRRAPILDIGWSLDLSTLRDMWLHVARPNTKKHTRRIYGHYLGLFVDWCVARGLDGRSVGPATAAAWAEQQGGVGETAPRRFAESVEAARMQHEAREASGRD